MEDCTTRLSAPSVWPVSFKYDTTIGHTSAIFATTSTKPGLRRCVCNNRLSQSGTRRNPVPSLCALQALHHKFRHWERVETLKHRRSSPLEIKCGVLHELDTVPTSQIACKSLCQNMRTSMQGHNRCIWTSTIQKCPQNHSLQFSIFAESFRDRNRNTAKCGSLPLPHYHPNLWTALFKFDAALSIRLHPTKHTRNDAGCFPFKMID